MLKTFSSFLLSTSKKCRRMVTITLGQTCSALWMMTEVIFL